MLLEKTIFKLRLWAQFHVWTVLLVPLLASSTVRSQSDTSADYSELPKTFATSKDPVIQQRNFYHFIWRSFIALNWPNVPLEIEQTPDGPIITSGLRGQPDSGEPLSVMSGSSPMPLAVWEAYKAPSEVFPPAKLWNSTGKWNSVGGSPEGASLSSGKRALLGYPIEFVTYATDTFQPYFFPHKTGPLYDQDGGLVRYEVAVNWAFFKYVRYFKYFNRDQQIEAVKNYIEGKRDESAFQRPPFGNIAETGPGGYLSELPEFAQTGLVDVKAAWRVLDRKKPEQIERYLHREIVVGYDDNGKPQMKLMGLVALHILRWTPNGFDPANGVDGAFVASTFEQIDNVTSNIDRYGNLVKPTFNDGSMPTPEELEYGFAGEVPGIGDPPANIYRARAQRIPPELQAINEHYRTSSPVNTSVLQYYQLIGTQNKHLGPVSFSTSDERERNGPQGPIAGVITNSNNLVNSALESYTQKNFTCILCHKKARPFGVVPTNAQHPVGAGGSFQIPGVPDKAFEDDHFKILTFLLQLAKPPEK